MASARLKCTTSAAARKPESLRLPHGTGRDPRIKIALTTLLAPEGPAEGITVAFGRFSVALGGRVRYSEGGLGFQSAKGLSARHEGSGTAQESDGARPFCSP